MISYYSKVPTWNKGIRIENLDKESEDVLMGTGLVRRSIGKNPISNLIVVMAKEEERIDRYAK